jgi:replicative DNA helicase
VVREKAVLRDLIRAANDVVARAHDTESDVEQIADDCEHLIFRAAERGVATGFTPLRPLVSELFDQIEEGVRTETPATGLPTGFVEVDGLISGMHTAELLVIAARPGMGKTALALKVASHVAVQEKQPVAIFSLDMSKEQVAERLLCAEARIDQQAVRQRMLDEADYQRIVWAAQRLYDAPIFVDDSASIRVLELRARARRMAADQGPLGLIIVDYLQLVDGGGRFDNRTAEIGHVSRSLKSLARELRTPVIACAQLSRAVETRGQVRRPMLSDLRESGSIEAEADVVMFIYRPMYYGEEELQRAEYSLDQSGIAEIIVAKQRNGPTGKVTLAWVDRCATFEELAHYEEG